VKSVLNWEEIPWERVGYLDLVKCPTRIGKRQWTGLKPTQKERFVAHCEGYLKEQLKIYRPKILLVYGARVCKWFGDYLNVDCEDFEDAPAQLNGEPVHVLFVQQRQGSQTKPEIDWVRKKILKMLNAKIRTCPFNDSCDRTGCMTIS
jgi:uracil-DNA glycosylase